MAQPPLSLDVATQMVDVVNECYAEGFAVVGNSQTRAAMTEAAQRLDISRATLASRLEAALRLHGIKPDPEQFQPKPKPEPKPLFTVDPLPNDGEPSAEELIEQLTRRHRDRATHHDAAKLRQVQVKMDGPVALAFFGDPHIDDPGCAWGDLERDVAICRDTPGDHGCQRRRYHEQLGGPPDGHLRAARGHHEASPDPDRVADDFPPMVVMGRGQS